MRSLVPVRRSQRASTRAWLPRSELDGIEWGRHDGETEPAVVSADRSAPGVTRPEDHQGCARGGPWTPPAFSDQTAAGGVARVQGPLIFAIRQASRLNQRANSVAVNHPADDRAVRPPTSGRAQVASVKLHGQ